MTERRPDSLEDQTRRFKAELAELLAVASERRAKLDAEARVKRGGRAA